MNSRVPINYLKSIEHIVQIYNYSIKTQTFDIPTKNVIAPKKNAKLLLSHFWAFTKIISKCSSYQLITLKLISNKIFHRAGISRARNYNLYLTIKIF